MGEDLKPVDDVGRSRHPIFIWLFCIFIGLAAVAVLFLLLSQRGWRPVEQTLSDGTILSIEAATFGTNHAFSTHPIRERIREALPNRLKPFLGKGNFTGRMQTAPNSLVRWTMRFDPASGMYIVPQSEQHYTTDEHGCRFQSNYRWSAALAGNAVMGVAFDAFPRTATHFDYVICDSSGKVLGNLNVANLFQSKSQRWFPEKVPITKTNGDLVVELQRFWRWNSTTRLLPDISVVRPRHSDLWDKGAVWFCDSSGNRTLFGPLCTNNRVWKIEANFFRKSHAQFRPDETWIIAKVAIPHPGEIVPLHKTNTFQGCLVGVESLAGVGNVKSGRSTDVRRTPPEARPLSLPPDPPALSIWSRQWNNEIRILIRAKDDSGRKLVTRAQQNQPMGYWRHAAHWQQKFDIHPLPDSKSLDIEVLVQKPTKFEFLVAPSQATVSD